MLAIGLDSRGVSQNKANKKPILKSPRHTHTFLTYVNNNKKNPKPLASRSSGETCKSRLCMKVIGDISSIIESRVGDCEGYKIAVSPASTEHFFFLFGSDPKD